MKTIILLIFIALSTSVFADSSFCTSESSGRIRLNKTGSYRVVDVNRRGDTDHYISELNIDHHAGAGYYKIDTRVTGGMEGDGYWFVEKEAHRKTIPELDSGHTGLFMLCEGGSLDIYYGSQPWTHGVSIYQEKIYDPVTQKETMGLRLMIFESFNSTLYYDTLGGPNEEGVTILDLVPAQPCACSDN